MNLPCSHINYNSHNRPVSRTFFWSDGYGGISEVTLPLNRDNRTREIIKALVDGEEYERIQEETELRHRDMVVESKKAQFEDSNSDVKVHPLDAIPDPESDLFSQVFGESESDSSAVRKVKEVMKMLTEAQRDLIYDIYGAEMSMVDIAERDNIAKQAVFNRLAKIKKRVAKLLKEMED